MIIPRLKKTFTFRS